MLPLPKKEFPSQLLKNSLFLFYFWQKLLAPSLKLIFNTIIYPEWRCVSRARNAMNVAIISYKLIMKKLQQRLEVNRSSLRNFSDFSFPRSKIQSRSPSMPVRRLRVGIALEKSNWFTFNFQREFYACSAIVAKYK